MADIESFYIIDSEIIRIYKNDICFEKLHRCISFPANEKNKTLSFSNKLINELLNLGIKRNSRVICIGGGITQDVCGFVASILFRGVQWQFIPTTLLSQVDSCVGGKTSLNFNKYKNIIGSFYPPQKIHMIPKFILTLNNRDYYSGLGELVKLHVIGGEERIHQIVTKNVEITERDLPTLENFIYDSLRIKIEYIQYDEFDQGKRVILNYGHTFGHALETGANYHIPHGQAVIFGMIFANIISTNRNKLSKSYFDFLNYKLFFPYLLSKIDFNKISPDYLVKCIRLDKKQTNKNITMVLLSEKYGLNIDKDITELEVMVALQALQDLYHSNSHIPKIQGG